MNIKGINIFIILFALIRSIPINLKLFSLKKALKLPIIVSPLVKIRSLKGEVLIENSEIKFGMIKIGFGDVGIFDKVFSRTIIQIEGKVVFHGKTNIGHGSRIFVGKNGILEIGDKFNITAETAIICYKNIKFGNNNLISWENLFMDTDFHKVKELGKNEMTNKNKEISIGNNVWIGCRNIILKGTVISDNSIVGANSLLNKKFVKENIMIVGNPAKIIKENIEWEF